MLHGDNKDNCLHAPWSLPWCPGNRPSSNLQFPHRVPFTKRKNALVPLPVNNEAYMPAFVSPMVLSFKPSTTVFETQIVPYLHSVS